MEIVKALINDRLRVSKVFRKFGIKPYFLTVTIIFSVYKQNFMAQ